MEILRLTAPMTQDSQFDDTTPKLRTEEDLVLPKINDHDTFSEVLGKLSMLGFLHGSITRLDN